MGPVYFMRAPLSRLESQYSLISILATVQASAQSNSSPNDENSAVVALEGAHLAGPNH